MAPRGRASWPLLAAAAAGAACARGLLAFAASPSASPRFAPAAGRRAAAGLRAVPAGAQASPAPGASAWGAAAVGCVGVAVAAAAASRRAGGAAERGALVACSAGRRAAALAAAVGTTAGAAPRAEAETELKYPVLGDEDIMRKKAHGSSPKEVQQKLRWGVSRKEADRICSFNRDFAEFAGYWRTTSFIPELKGRKEQNPSNEPETTFFDSVTGKPLFIAPRGRTVKAFLEESYTHGWPSFRDEEVVWENVRCLKDGECVSVDGTHLGHNIPDGRGNRYCINIVSVAGKPLEA